MNYLIVSPVRSGSTWLNLVIAKHYNLFNVGESLCKISPGILLDPSKERFIEGDKVHLPYTQQMQKLFNIDFRKLSREQQITELKKTPFVIKFTPWDLYEGSDEAYGYGYEFDNFREELKPMTTIFLYRKNLLEHFISFNAVHKTGVMNADSPFMNYQRPKMEYNQEELDYYLAHKHIWEETYKEHGHKFDYTISYEELFKMNELCGIPLKDYHEEFTLKLNRYTREELEECKQQTGLEDNYEIC